MKSCHCDSMDEPRGYYAKMSRQTYGCQKVEGKAKRVKGNKRHKLPVIK